MPQAESQQVACIDEDEPESPQRHVKILTLHEQGKTQTEIALTLNCSQSQVSRTIAKYDSTGKLAKLRAHNRALEVVNAAFDGAIKAASEGKPEAALEIGDRLGVLERRQQDAGRGSQVLIQIGMPGQPAGSDPIIDLSPTTFASKQLGTESVSD